MSCGYSNSKHLSSFLDTLENGSMKVIYPNKTQNSALLQEVDPSHSRRIAMLISIFFPSYIAFIIKNFLRNFSLTTWEHTDFTFFLSQQLEFLILELQITLDYI